MENVTGGRPLRVLLVEDHPTVAAMLRAMLTEIAPGAEVVLAANLAEAHLHLAANPDVILLDLGLPDSAGLDTFVAIHDRSPGTPIVVITGLDDESLGVHAVQRGAQDYLLKIQLNLPMLTRSIRYAIERQRLLTELKHRLAFHDSLTGLPNRQLFFDRLGHAIAESRRSGQSFAVLFLDLDGFKAINDSFGHQVGDLLLQAVAQRLRNCLRASDTAARLGGDEFTIIVGGEPQPEDAAKVAEKILNALSRRFGIGAQQFFISGSIGIAVCPTDGADAETLVRNADVAMYRAKALGKNGYQFYDLSLDAAALERLGLEKSLRAALAEGQFVLHYQPQLSLQNAGLTGAEAMLRWQHPELGLLLPERFLALAEDTGLIIPIGEWVLRTACAQGQSWQLAGHRPLRMSVNVSPRHFGRPTLPDLVARTLAESGLAPEQLSLDIDESCLMQDPEQGLNALRALKRLGVQIAVDDFGTGYSRLGSLRRFPIDMLKIDRSFVRGIPHEPEDAEIAALIVALARRLRLTVLAEGIETPEQLEFLRAQGCDEGQGFALGPPVPADSFSRLLEEAPLA